MSENKPVSGTKEWAAHNVNCMRGCPHDCKFCYAHANAARFKRPEADNWAEEVPNPVALKKKFGKKTGAIMFPTTHDLTPGNIEYTLPMLLKMLKAGNDVLVVSKPHLDVIEKICDECEEYKAQILFRFTIGSSSDETLRAWEPGAPNIMERLKSLGHAHKLGFRTSVSMEPLLETNEDEIVALVEILAPLVTDSIWIGKMNRPVERMRRNGYWVEQADKDMAEALIASQSDECILALYERLKDYPRIKWKESIKKVVGIEIPTESGLDI